jgi:rRNA maturation RNase YbeY
LKSALSHLAPPLLLDISAASARDHVPFLRRQIRLAHGLLRPVLRELSIALVGDRKMSRLHQQFLQVSGTTDVLTFPLETDRHGRPISGAIAVCVSEARRQATRRKIALRNELLLYALHGLLHLCGFDDRTDADFRKMHHMEDKLLRKLGIGAVFAPPIAPAAAQHRRG